jgi:hypothetical protein
MLNNFLDYEYNQPYSLKHASPILAIALIISISVAEQIALI